MMRTSATLIAAARAAAAKGERGAGALALMAVRAARYEQDRDDPPNPFTGADEFALAEKWDWYIRTIKCAPRYVAPIQSPPLSSEERRLDRLRAKERRLPRGVYTESDAYADLCGGGASP